MALPCLPRSTDLGLLLIRLMLGAVGVFHGSQKLFSAFGGVGMQKFTEMLASMNVPAPQVSAYLAAITELGGGVLIALGIFPRLAAIAFAFNMAVAIKLVHSHAFSAQDNGMEYPLTLGIMALAIVVAGAGRYALLKPGSSAPPPPAA